MGREAYFKDKDLMLTHREEPSLTALILELTFIALAALILVPSIVLVVTKDALPNDSLYPYKLKLESVLLTTLGNTSFKTHLNLLIVGRRFEEGTLMFKRTHSGDFFGDFVDQMNNVTKDIVENPVREIRLKDSVEFINRLKGYKDVLDTLITRQEDNIGLSGISGQIDKAIELLDTRGIK